MANLIRLMSITSPTSSTLPLSNPATPSITRAPLQNPHPTLPLFELSGYNLDSPDPVNLLSTTLDIDPHPESIGITNLHRNTQLTPAIKQYELARLAKPNLKLDFGISIELSNLFTHPTPLTNPKVTFGSHPAPFLCTQFQFVFNPTTDQAQGYATFYNPCSKLLYTTAFQLSSLPSYYPKL